eukprot:7563253-Alexandrium_andersonii.AAC.1
MRQWLASTRRDAEIARAAIDAISWQQSQWVSRLAAKLRAPSKGGAPRWVCLPADAAAVATGGFITEAVRRARQEPPV